MTDAQPQPGDPCPRCGNVITVYCTRLVDGYRVRYLGCRRRGDRPGGCGKCYGKLVEEVGSTELRRKPAAAA